MRSSCTFQLNSIRFLRHPPRLDEEYLGATWVGTTEEFAQILLIVGVPESTKSWDIEVDAFPSKKRNGSHSLSFGSLVEC